jgi:gliding motility-associated-like protein
MLWLMPHAQNCTNPGQTPATAFPVCGTSVFHQTSVPICSSHDLLVPGCSSQTGGYQDKNPFWYKFTCFAAGTLGFLITPTDMGDDYDWQLYDITGRNPDDVFSDSSLIVTGNWAGTYGVTGASDAGVAFIQCGSDPTENRNKFAKMPTLIEGHTYLLLISHFTDTQSGYDLAFQGGTAVITDPLPPAMKSAAALCDAQVIRVQLNKKMLCSSLAADGSDFVILPNNHPVQGAASLLCTNGFDTDSVEVRLTSPLDPGNYEIAIRTGSDANTMLDNCGNAIPEGQRLSFTVIPALPTKLDSIVPVGCAPDEVTLVFKKPVYCNTVAPDGTDFVITGLYAVNINAAVGECSGGLSQTITLKLDKPMVDKGNFKVTLRRNAQGGTPLDECGIPIPEGSVDFSVADTVSAAFDHVITYGCTTDRVQFNHAGNRDVNSWQWTLDDGKTSTVQAPQADYTEFDTKMIQLAVSNGICTDTVQAPVVLENFLSVDFTTTGEECPNEPVQFQGNAVGQGLQHAWNFDDGGTSSEAQPVHSFAAPTRTRALQVKYSVTDRWGCTKTAIKPITIYSSCTVFVPNAFTPGGDGRNDVFKPLNAFKVEQYEFVVYNRWGQEIFKTRDPKQGWDGTVGGVVQNTGTYIWTLRYTQINGGRQIEQKGSLVLIR